MFHCFLFLLFLLSNAYIWEFDINKFNTQRNNENITIINLYYIPYGSSYKEYLTTYKEVDSQFHGNKDVIVGKIDCEEYEMFCEDKLLKNSKELKTTLYDISGLEMNEIKDINVLTIDESNESMLKGITIPLFVKFYTTWCSHCRELQPEFDNASRMSPIQFAQVDCDKNQQICATYEITTYPTIKYFSKTSKVIETYKGDRSTQALTAFCEEKIKNEKDQVEL
ncbi:Protein disulfide isomerase [Entamoeba marina]